MNDAEVLVDPLRVELAEFLRTRRAELAPESVGLPHTGRRRTPGLRREEVAELAGISTALYSWLEQARDVPVSKHTLDAIASALRLSADERAHLQNLGRPEPTELYEYVSPALRRMVMSLHTHGAYVLDHVWDIVLENPAASALFGPSGTPEAEKNLLKRVLFSEHSKSAIVDWETTAAGLIERLQFDFAAWGGDPRMTALATELRAHELFVRVWETHRVRRTNYTRTLIEHETLGTLSFETTSYAVPESPGLRVVLFTPCEEEMGVRLQRLVERETGSGCN